MRLALALALLASPAIAQMSGGEFDAYATGRTLTYAGAGGPYGVERYHEGRRVTWAFLDDQCSPGTWREDSPGVICFAYEDYPEEQCWRFFAEGTGLRAEFVGGEGSSFLYEVEDQLPLVCPDYGS